MPYDLEVNTPTGKHHLITSMVYKNYDSDREIEFKINLLREISPISKTPYRMILAELFVNQGKKISRMKFL